MGKYVICSNHVICIFYTQAFCAMAEVSCMLQASLAVGYNHAEECQIGTRKKESLFLSVPNSELNLHHVTFHLKAYKYGGSLEIFLHQQDKNVS